jgi:hypothetical protein
MARVTVGQAWLPWREVPIIINSFNRLSCLERLVGWLQQASYVNLHVIDNASTYPPLLAYLKELERSRQAKITRLGQNLGPRGLWRHDLLRRLRINTEYVYSDPDVVSVQECPHDLVGRLQSVLTERRDVAVVGVGLRLDDLPDTYRYKEQAIAWERQFWTRPAGPGLFYASIDTTFALYRPGGSRRGGFMLRTDWPYMAMHEGWYRNHTEPSEEDIFYSRTVRPGISHWSASKLPSWLKRYATERCNERGAE